MDLIRNYIEALFSTLPKTREVVDMKCGLLEHLEETYERLRSEGKSEAEAAGLALSGIGTAAEIRSELGLPDETEAPAVETEAEAKLRTEYFAFKKKQALAVAVAIGLFILAPLTVILLGDAGFGGASLAPFFVCIAVAVGLLVYHGIQDTKFREALGMKTASPEAGRRDAKFDALSGILWVGTATLYLVLGFVYGYWHPGWLVFLAAVVLQIGIDYFAKSKAHSDASR